MPHESSQDLRIDNSRLSSLPEKRELEPRRDQPLGGAPLLAEGSNTPPYPKAPLNDVVVPAEDVEVWMAVQDLLILITSMRKRAEKQYQSRASRSENVASAHPRREL